MDAGAARANGEPTPEQPVIAWPVVALGLGILLAGALPFFLATTFIDDDHLFLAFARHAPNPLVAFVRDQHGGEFYRPLPMCLWWLLGRLAGASPVPFATAAFLLHAGVAAEVGALVDGVSRDRARACLAGALFFLAPMAREAAFWYSASTDLLAGAFGLAAVLALLRGRGTAATTLAVACFAAACWSKESAVVVPLLAIVALRAARHHPGSGWRGAVRRAAPLFAVIPIYLVARTRVLGGIGGAGDPAAPLLGKLVQIAAGLIHAVTGWETVSGPVAWALGIAASLAIGVGLARRRGAMRDELAPGSAGSTSAVFPLAWIGLAVAPLLAAPWVLGARYFYLAMTGVAWLAADLLKRAPLPALIGVLAALGGLDLAQGLGRRGDILDYQARLAAARRAVASGLAQGDDTFHVASGIKDIDLAVKEDPAVAGAESRLVVLGDVPASFVALPEARARDLEFVLARPPLPPSGAYRFGDRRIVGLARREDDPGLDEVLARLPGIRFIRLRAAPGGRVTYRDVTAEITAPAD